MRKSTLLSTSLVAAFAALNAYADGSNVQLYGRVNLTIENTKVQNSTSVNQVVDNASRFGIRGEEKLNDNLSAIFQIESRVRAESGTGTLASRDTWVGLKGNFGRAAIGNITNPLYSATYDNISMHNHDTGNSSDALMWFNSGLDRLTNSAQYDTPTWGGFNAQVFYSLKDDSAADAAGNKDRVVTGVLNYSQGPFSVSGGYTQGKLSPSVKDWSAVVAGFFDAKFATFGLLIDRVNADSVQSNGAKRNGGRFAVKVPIQNHELHANVGYAGKFGTVADSKALQYTLGYNYNLSKRTKAYAFYTKIDNKQNANYHNFGAGAGLDERSFAIGLRHNF